METKQCSKCGEVKPLVEYGTLKGIPHKMPWCKVCNRNRYKKFKEDNPEQELQRIYEWRKNNDEWKEWKRSYSRKWSYEQYHNNPIYKFNRQLFYHLEGVENREEFIDKWGDVKKSYEEKGIPSDTDHLIPKNWFIENTDMELINHIDNLQVIDREYNRSKQDRWSDPVPSDYLDKIRPYIKKEYEGLLKSL